MHRAIRELLLEVPRKRIVLFVVMVVRIDKWKGHVGHRMVLLRSCLGMSFPILDPGYGIVKFDRLKAVAWLKRGPNADQQIQASQPSETIDHPQPAGATASMSEIVSI